MNSKYKNLCIAILTTIVLVGIAYTSQAQYAVNVSSNNGKSTYKINNAVGDYKVEFEGNFRLSGDDKDIVSISRGGYFEISKSSFGASRRVRIESDGDQLNRRYYVGWSEVGYEPEGRKWLGEVLPDLVRSTTIAAASRVDRIYSNHGASGLIAEVGLLEGDYVTSSYLTLIFKKTLGDPDLAKLLAIAADRISSDHYLSNVLIAFQKKYALNAITARPYVDAAAEVGSDHYRANIFISVAKNKDIPDEFLTEAIRGTLGINSDHYKSNTLKAFINEKKLDAKQLEDWLDACADISSGHYLSNTLIELLKEQELNSANIGHFLNAAKNIDSDVYAVNAYLVLLEIKFLSNNDLMMILESVDQIDSDNYLNNLLKAMLNDKRDTPVLKKLFDEAARNIGSDHYLSDVLKTAVNKQTIEKDATDAFVDAIMSIGSGNYVYNVVLESRNVAWSNGDLIKLVNACATISSDHYLSQSLTALAPLVNRGSESVKTAYRMTAKRISSETYYGRAMKALDY